MSRYRRVLPSFQPLEVLLCLFAVAMLATFPFIHAHQYAFHYRANESPQQVNRHWAVAQSRMLNTDRVARPAPDRIDAPVTPAPMLALHPQIEILAAEADVAVSHQLRHLKIGPVRADRPQLLRA
jgi:hypothetical protein